MIGVISNKSIPQVFPCDEKEDQDVDSHWQTNMEASINDVDFKDFNDFKTCVHF